MVDAVKHTGADAYEVLRREILYGALMPGERLRGADLNARYQLGLTPIREALMRLTSVGLVTWKSRRGARVPDLDVDEFRDLVRTRREIGRSCLTRAIERGDAAWEAEILRAFHMLARAPAPNDSDAVETAGWERLHREFHYALIAACGSLWLLRIWERLADHAERYRNPLLRSGPGQTLLRDANREHEEIMQATLARDVPAATALLDTHLARIENAAENFI